MTRPELYKVGGSLAVLLLGWLLRRRPPGTGSVELGVPTVTGSGAEQLGDQGYYSDRPLVPDGQRFATDPEMDRLIRESNAAIAAADAEQAPESE